MRARFGWLAAAFAAAVALAVGCGGNFPLPTESNQRTEIPSDGSYQMIATWKGWDGIRDLLLTQGSGSQLFALVNYGGSGTSQRGAVRELSRTGGNFIGPPFPGLFNPVALAAGGDGLGAIANRVFVLDQGDTCIARTNPATGLCDTTGTWRPGVPGSWGNRITDIAHYWKVVEFDLLGAEKSSFTDTMFAFVNGVASDDQGHVYVSGLAIILLPTTDPRVLERTYEYRVWRYLRGLRSDGSRDPNVPYGNWHRDTGFEIRQGTGVGAAIDPRGIDWNPTTGPALYIADLGNFRGEKVRDGNTTLPDSRYYHTLDFGTAPDLQQPLDITTDRAGFFYIADSTGAQVLRYDDAGPGYVQRVDVEKNSDQLPLLGPVTVAADNDYAYVGDAGRGEIIRYKRRK
jgi:hypothetical protein